MREWIPSAPTRQKPPAVVPSAKHAATRPSTSDADASALLNSNRTPASAAASNLIRLKAPRITVTPPTGTSPSTRPVSL